MTAYGISLPDGRAEYGKRTAVTLAILLHASVLVGLVGASIIGKRPRPPENAMVVKLGGPANLKLSGAKTKAPVAGVRKKTTPKPVARGTSKPKAKKSVQVGLNREKPKAAKTSPSKSDRLDPSSRRKETTAPPKLPVEVEDEKGTRAFGGIDGTRGAGVSVEVGDGSEAIETQDLEFISYFRTVQAEVASRWVKTGLEGGTTKVRFIIQRDGSVVEVEIVRSSGRTFLDGPAQRAVLGSEFPPLPQGYLGERLIVNINFHYGVP